MSDLPIGGVSVVQPSMQTENTTPSSSISVDNTTTAIRSNNPANKTEPFARKACYDKVFTGSATEDTSFENMAFMDAKFITPCFDKPVVFRNCTFAADKQPLQETFQQPTMKRIIWDNVILDGLHQGEPSVIPCQNFSGMVMKNGTLSDLVFSGTANQALVDADFSGNKFINVAFLGEGRRPFEFSGVNFTGIDAINLKMGNIKFRQGVRFINLEKIHELLLSGPVDFSGAGFGWYKKESILLSREHVSDWGKTFDNLCDNNFIRPTARLFKSLGTIINFEFHRDAKEQVVQFFLEHPLLDYALAHSSALRQSVLCHTINMSAHSDKIAGFLQDKLITYHGQTLLNDAERTHVSVLLRKMAPERLIEHQFLVNQLLDVRQTMNAQPPIKAFIEYARQFDKSDNGGVIFYVPESDQAIYLAEDEFNALMAGETVPQHPRLLTRDRADDSIIDSPLNDEMRETLLQHFPTLQSLWTGRGRKLSEIIAPLFHVPEYLTSQHDDVVRLGSHVLAQLTKVTREPLNLESADDVDLLKNLFSPFMSANPEGTDDTRQKRTVLIERVCNQLDLHESGLNPDEQKFAASLILARLFINLFSPTHCSTDSITHSWLNDFAKQFLIDAYQYCPTMALNGGVDEVMTQINDNRSAAALFLIDSLLVKGANGADISGLIHQHSPIF